MSKNANKYYLPITIKDQYGNILKADDLSSLQIYTSDASIVKLANPPIVEHNDKGTVIKFQNTDYEKSGTAIITVVAPITATSSTKTLVILDKPKIDMVSLSKPVNTLKQNTAVILPVSIVDTLNKQIDLNDITYVPNGNTLVLNSNTFITVIGGVLSVDRDYAKGVTNIKCHYTYC